MNLKKQINTLNRQADYHRSCLNDLKWNLNNLDFDPTPKKVRTEFNVRDLTPQTIIDMFQTHGNECTFTGSYFGDIFLVAPVLETVEQVDERLSATAITKQNFELSMMQTQNALAEINREVAKLKDEQARIRSMDSAARYQHFKEQQFKENEAKTVQEK